MTQQKPSEMRHPLSLTCGDGREHGGCAAFPAGTVSGVPKIRAMQIIADLEGMARGPYGGWVGCFSFKGNLGTCIAIRIGPTQGSSATR